MWTFRGVEVHWLGHDSIILKGSRTVALDPFKTKGKHEADLLLITHEHFDHLSEEDLRRFVGGSTTLVAPRICESQLAPIRAEKVFVAPGSRLQLKGVTIETIPAYNLNKFKSPGQVFHPKEEGRVGYVVTLDGVRFYHSGDSDATPEMKSLSVDVAFLPVSGTYVMTAEEAAEAASSMRLEVAIPMHIESIVGTMADAQRFHDLLEGSRKVVILEKE